MDKGEIMSTIKETTLHPDGNEGVDLYPKTNINQVQELPQKLTSVENQINQLNIDKLTKPTNPSAESAVTMLADGTVGTKLLSEIGGGKTYKHHITLSVTSDGAGGYQSINGMIFFDIYSSSSTAITVETIPQLASGDAYIAYLYNPGNDLNGHPTQGVVGVKFDPTHHEIEVWGAGTSTMEQFHSLYYLFAYNDATRFVDDYTEI